MEIKTAIYWLKRDFRLADNIALSKALDDAEKVVPLFILEPSFLEAPETSSFHVHAVMNALTDLRNRLNSRKVELAIVHGEVIPTLNSLYHALPFQAIYAHEEVGIERTYARDRAVIKWCKAHNVTFKEYRQTGVFRGLQDRNKRNQAWKEFTFNALRPIPSCLKKCTIPESYSPLTVDTPDQLDDIVQPYSLTAVQRGYVQPVSESAAQDTLHSFLYDRGINYKGGISSPLTAMSAGSRLSVHLAWGTISGRTVYQKSIERISELKELKENGDPQAGKFAQSLRSFVSRLHWRDHFIQRLESEPEMEFNSLNPAYQNLQYDNNKDYLDAWIHGVTGYPMVDACVRCLRTSGFINFRMRAMLTSFACHLLHLDWRLIDKPMAQMYTDYEPGIHLSQLQMQAGVVGINTVRIYSPTKQISDQDPDTTFIKKWVPELRSFSPEDIVNHREDMLGKYSGQLVEWKSASSEMRKRIYAIRRTENYKAIAAEVYNKHGSRKRPPKKKKSISK